DYLNSATTVLELDVREREPLSEWEPRAPKPEPPVPDGRSLWWVLASLSLLIAILSFLQAPGHLVADTKLDLVVNPGGFLSRALLLWDSLGSFGQIQNQAVGYLFPMGPFFALGHAVALPMWIVQRLWMTLLLSAALWGAALVSRELGIRNEGAVAMAGAAYAL